MKYDLEAAELRRQLEQVREEVGMYQGMYAANFVEITKLKHRIGVLKSAQRKAHLPFKGAID